MGVMTLSYFVLNSGLVAAAIGLEFGRPPLTVWRQHFAWLVPNYLAGAAISLLLLVALRQVGLGAVALILPLLLLSYTTVRTSLGRAEDADRYVAKVDRLYLSTIETLATAIDAKDEVTHGHIRRVQTGAVGLARRLGVNDEGTIKAIEAAALLHDTGKLAIPEHILNKPGKLTAEEFEVMKQHARIGAEILAPVDFPFPVVPIVRHHHENWDVSGYPDGLSGTDIPIGARILSVVDCFDALMRSSPVLPRRS
jgi:putative nucleotidyltransferase with HDIG domain